MLRSFNEDSPSDDQQHPYQHNPPLAAPVPVPIPVPAPLSRSPVTHMRQLLMTCAELVSSESADLGAAHRLISLLSSTSSPYGDSTDRLVHQFARALSRRLSRQSFSNLVLMVSPNSSSTAAAAAAVTASASASASASGSEQFELLRYESSYISLNQVTPFIRFSHLTANQAILDAIEQGGGQQSIHILDMDTMKGVQWPPLMQAIAARWNPPPMIRITGTGTDMDSLRRTGNHLQEFAQSLGLTFHFHPVLLHPHQQTHHLLHQLHLLPHETLAVNCVLYLHRLLPHEVRLFLTTIKAMNPKLVTLAEREANHNNPNFMQRFVEALDHYTALFDSLEATLPPNSQERLAVEQVWFGREIVDLVSAEGEERRERHQRFQNWVEMMTTSGFTNLPLSPFALSQAKYLLRLHYPSEGYHLQMLNDSFFLGWQNHPLFSVSSWH